MRATLRHELTHHVEDLAGDHSLEDKDSDQLDVFYSEEYWTGSL